MWRSDSNTWRRHCTSVRHPGMLAAIAYTVTAVTRGTGTSRHTFEGKLSPASNGSLLCRNDSGAAGTWDTGTVQAATVGLSIPFFLRELALLRFWPSYRALDRRSKAVERIPPSAGGDSKPPCHSRPESGPWKRERAPDAAFAAQSRF